MKLSRFSSSSSSRNSSRNIIFWSLLPFVGCLAGYFLSGYFIQKAEIATPLLIGKSLLQAVEILSQDRLGVRLLMQKEDVSLPESTIIDQLPRPGQLIRLNQNVFVTTSTRQPPLAMPDWWGKRVKDLLPVCEKSGFEATVITLPSHYPQGMCIAQFPTAGQPMQGRRVRVYVSGGMLQLAIMPNYKGLTVAAFEKVLEHKDIRVEYLHAKAVEVGHQCTQCVINDQYPVAGSIVDTIKTINIQVQVSLPVVAVNPVEQLPVQPVAGSLDLVMPILATSDPLDVAPQA